MATKGGEMPSLINTCFKYASRGLFGLAIVMSIFTIASSSQTLDSKYWVPNNTVNSIIVDDAHDLVYIGGDFDYLGPITGNFAALDPTTGSINSSFPKVSSMSGNVNAVISDGAGGLFIGGFFSKVGNVSINNLAHILSDGSVDNTWNPNPDDGVSSLALNGNSLIVGGYFSNIGGQADADLSSVSVTTGNVDPTWTKPNLDNSVATILVYGNRIYIGGYFSTVGDSSRNQLASLDLDGNVRAWNPSPSGDFGSIGGLDAANGYIYVAGSFSSIGSQSVEALAELDTTDGNATSWNTQDVSISGIPYCQCVKVIGGNVFFGGSFDAIGDSTRYSIASVDTASALPTRWDAGLLQGSSIQTITNNGAQIYFSGDFSSVQGQTRTRFADVDTNGTLQSWNASASDYASALLYYSGKVFAGGDMYSFGGVLRQDVAALSEITGQPTGLKVAFDDNSPQVSALALHDTTLFVGGVFQSVGGNARDGFVTVSANTGDVTSFDANLAPAPWSYYSGQADVIALKIYGGTIYVAGQFDSAGSGLRLPRNNIAAFDVNTGSLKSWNANVNGGAQPSVLALDAGGGSLYIGGAFADLGDSARVNLGSVDTVTGLATAWNPIIANSNDFIYSIAADGSTVYIGGSFTTMNSVTRNYAAAVDIVSTGSLLPWDPDLSSSADGFAVSGSFIYMGGYFQTIGGQPFNSIGAVDKTNGNPESWNLNLDATQYVQCIAISDKHQEVFFGGSESQVLGASQPYFAAVTNPSDASLPVQLISFDAQSTKGAVTLNWKTATEVGVAGFNLYRSSASAGPYTLLGSYSSNKSLAATGSSSRGASYHFVDNSAQSGKTYYYKIESLDLNGRSAQLGLLKVTVDIPENYALYQNYPNPFNPSTTIRFDLKEMSTVTLEVYNALGQKVFEQNYGTMNAGRYEENLSLGEFSSGMYFYRISAQGSTGDQFTSIKKLILLK